ncbi:DUF998 domain-containing protein [Mumia zhuanghuii]|uniref:DUF998 domain-containing protein n=1 Tax=Mumia zhuanghuii TaxID=2585211 RepID=UPI0036272F4D
MSTPTRRLLAAAALAGPVFYTSAIAQMVTRDGFDLREHPISQLSTDDLGWVQRATFVIAGLGVLGLAVAHRRLVTTGVGRRWLPILIGVFGGGLAVAGLFVMDPQYAFPAGTPDAPAPEMSWHSVVHSGAAAVAFTALAVACVVLTVRAIGARRTLPAIGSGLAAVILLVPVSPTHASIQIAVTGLVAFGWVSAYALHLRRLAS